MDSRQTTRVCGQCHKEVAEDNFALHESHCRRFLMLCPDCDDTVPRDQLDQHRQDQHTQVKCILCKQKVERCRLVDHESDECEERLVCCEYCELAVPWRALEEHSVACGSRTERCDDCGRYVTLKGRPEHAQTCPDIYSGSNGRNAIYDTTYRDTADNNGTANKDTADDNEQISVNCLTCQKPFPAEEIDEHELECVATSRKEEEREEEEEEEEEATPWLIESLKGASFSDRPREEVVVKGASFSDRPREEVVVKGASFSDRLREEVAVKGASFSDRPREEVLFRGDPDQISACPHCHLALPVVTLRWHEAKCQIHVNLK